MANVSAKEDTAACCEGLRFVRRTSGVIVLDASGYDSTSESGPMKQS